jgi:hypothetical protein
MQASARARSNRVSECGWYSGHRGRSNNRCHSCPQSARTAPESRRCHSTRRRVRGKQEWIRDQVISTRLAISSSRIPLLDLPPSDPPCPKTLSSSAWIRAPQRTNLCCFSPSSRTCMLVRVKRCSWAAARTQWCRTCARSPLRHLGFFFGKADLLTINFARSKK